MIVNSSIKYRVASAVSSNWRNRYGEVLTAAGGCGTFHSDGAALAQALNEDWATDVVILDLALASPALAARLGPAGPRLLAFGDPGNAGIALAGNLVDFISPTPSDEELTAALAAAFAPPPAVGVADLSDRSVARLGALGAEAARIADALARLETTTVAVPPPIDLDRLRAVIRARRARDRFFPPDLFGEPAWDMLLDLSVAIVERRDVAVSSLCIAAAVPTTTALRWIRTLCDVGLFDRRNDPHDARRAFISLSEAGTQAMARYLGQTTQPWS